MSDLFDPDQLKQLFVHDDDSVWQIFLQFLGDIAYRDGPVDLSTYQCPHGKLSARVFHFLHWPPETPGKPRSYQSIHRYTDSIQILLAIFPDAWGQALFHDYFCKRVLIAHPFTGNRKTDAEVYGNKSPSSSELYLHERLSRNLLEASDAEIIVVWGGPARRFFKQTFKNKSYKSDKRGMSVEEKYGIFEAEVGEKMRTVVFLPHPEFIQRWADPRVLKQVSDTCEKLFIEFDMSIDLALLEARLRTRDELRNVSVPRQPKKTLEEKRASHRATNKKWWDNRTEEQRQKFKAQHRKANVPEDMWEHKLAQNRKANLPEDVWEHRLALKRKENQTEEQWEKRIAPSRKINKTQAQLEATRKASRESKRRARSNMTEEELEASRAKQRQDYADKTEEGKEKIRAKARARMRKKSAAPDEDYA